MFTRRIFDGVLITILSAHLAFGLPRMWARTAQVTDGGGGLKSLLGRAILQATS